jgi:hypothetical protein
MHDPARVIGRTGFESSIYWSEVGGFWDAHNNDGTVNVSRDLARKRRLPSAVNVCRLPSAVCRNRLRVSAGAAQIPLSAPRRQPVRWMM